MREREKLYIQMENNYDELSTLNPDKLFLLLKTEKRNGRMSFIYYSEFLNILNTLIFFYACSTNIKNSMNDILGFIFLDATFIIYALIYYFIIKNKRIKTSNSNKIFIFAFIGIILSKIFFGKHEILEKTNIIISIHKYVKLSFIVLSISFLLTYDYSINSQSVSSPITKIIYVSMAFVVSSMVPTVFNKIRIFFYAINYFEFIPEIRKFTSHYSNKHNLFAYLINTLLILLYLIYIKNLFLIGFMFVFQVLTFTIYPALFNYYYKREKKPILGLWDIPKVISYY